MLLFSLFLDAQVYNMDDWLDLHGADLVEGICRGLLVLGLEDRNVIPHRLCSHSAAYGWFIRDCNNFVALGE